MTDRSAETAPRLFGFLGAYEPDGPAPDLDELKSRLAWPDAGLHTGHTTWLLRSVSNETAPGSAIARLDNGLSVQFTGYLLNREELLGQVGAGANDPDTQPATLCARLYRKFGVNFPARINGMFSIVLRDDDQDRICLYADRYGSVFPLFYREQPNLVFANQVKILLRCPGVEPAIDESALAVFLKYSYLPAPRSILHGVQRLGPGEMLDVKAGRVRRRRYDDFWRERLDIDPDQAKERYLEILDRSVRRKFQGFEPSRTGFFLSGGLDSSANVAMAAKAGLSPIKTFGIGVADPKVDERPFARQVAEQFGAEFTGYEYDGSEIEDFPRMVWYLDEPFMENGLF
ncbi:MAG: asparagine synthase-related protein, partial [bacterium]